MRLQDQSLELYQRARALQVTHSSPDGLVTATVQQAAAMAQEEIVRMFAPLVPPEQMRAHLDGDLHSVLGHLDDRLREIG
ncbi:hypothetical protein [Nonomuraea jabiensis]|uniref:Uncharacterized protein n=1 Tax=Nonomuraea jabiensis TaxID=882448 RepID=A0A7W9LFG0_9ACTN|nr:hypothetical protein [Nonomuraea jabiensis]MBB5781844.1 hypothetical protein [Nonomuraea jabiensis]